MCGFCTEYQAIYALQDDGNFRAPTESRQNNLYFYLVGVSDISSALRKFSVETVTKPWVASTILCRAIDMLMTHGFDSETYQNLLEQPQFIAAIPVACEARTEAAGSDVDTRFNSEEFTWLSGKDTYLVRGSFEQHVNESSDHTCTSLLNDYIDWWLEGGSVEHQDLRQIFKDTGILDPIDDISRSERQLLESRFITLWFVLLRTSRQSGSAEIIWKIITRGPSGVPDFDGLELWLQRRAALACYDQFGLAPFLSESQSIRAELFQYVVAARVIRNEEKKAVLAVLSGREYVHFGPEEWYWAVAPQK